MPGPTVSAARPANSNGGRRRRYADADEAWDGKGRHQQTCGADSWRTKQDPGAQQQPFAAARGLIRHGAARPDGGEVVVEGAVATAPESDTGAPVRCDTDPYGR